ncbi:MAG: hypothetical protein ACE5EM_09505 [Sphingomonadales bacterium]
MLFMHIGLHKTATTFFQQSVFPKWRGIEYLPWPNLEYFVRLEEGKTYLVSREGMSGTMWASRAERDMCIKRLSEMFPDARILISFRKHDGFISSAYRQYLHRGGVGSFQEFFDLEGDAGFMKQEDFVFRHKIESVVRHFKREPFVFMLEEIRNDLAGLLSDMRQFIGGAAPDPREIIMARHNKGVGSEAGKLLRRLNRWTRSELNPDGRFRLNQGLFAKLKITPRHLCQYYLSALPDRGFLTAIDRQRIDALYADDWKYVLDHIARRRIGAGEHHKPGVPSAAAWG